MKTLGNNTILLRALEPDDVALLYDWENDVSVWPFTATYIPFNRTTLLQYAQSVQDIFTDKQFRFVIERKEDQQAIGFIDLFDFDPIHRRAGVGILIASEENRGKNYGSEALQVLVDYGKNVLFLHQIYAHIAADNKRSMAMFEKCGFLCCGTKREWLKTNKGFVDEHIYQRIIE